LTTHKGTSLETPAIHASGLAKRYGSTVALAGLSLTVPKGEVFGFLGPNGAGKTTGVKLLLGLTRPTAGEAWLLGTPAADASARRRVGYLPELFRYQGWLSAREVLAVQCELARLPRARWPNEIASALREVGLESRANDRVEGFSKGMQQRLGLGVALLGQPELVVLDEPTSALDPLGRLEVRTLIRGLRDRGVAVFLNSHLLTEVEHVCDRVAIVDHGRVIASGRLDEMLGGSGVRLRVSGLEDAALEGLARFGQVSASDGWLNVAVPNEETVPSLVADVVQHGGRVYAVEPSHMTLEDRFLQLVEHSEEAS
jgi:ABC-2 type transport system ATP-binding protein